jgi:hypothetical protein
MGGPVLSPDLADCGTVTEVLPNCVLAITSYVAVHGTRGIASPVWLDAVTCVGGTAKAAVISPSGLLSVTRATTSAVALIVSALVLAVTGPLRSHVAHVCRRPEATLAGTCTVSATWQFGSLGQRAVTARVLLAPWLLSTGAFPS